MTEPVQHGSTPVRSSGVRQLVIAALLIAVGVVIPMYSPLKVVIEPASFTLASHVAIFIAMFVSPWVAVAVALGTTAGFLAGGFPIVVVARALSHVVWALAGAWWLRRHPDTLRTTRSTVLFALSVALLHAVCEVLAVTPFYLMGQMPPGFYEGGGFMVLIAGLVGGGTVLHSLVDFAIALAVWTPIARAGLAGERS